MVCMGRIGQAIAPGSILGVPVGQSFAQSRRGLFPPALSRPDRDGEGWDYAGGDHPRRPCEPRNDQTPIVMKAARPARRDHNVAPRPVVDDRP